MNRRGLRHRNIDNGDYNEDMDINLEKYAYIHDMNQFKHHFDNRIRRLEGIIIQRFNKLSTKMENTISQKFHDLRSLILNTSSGKESNDPSGKNKNTWTSEKNKGENTKLTIKRKASTEENEDETQAKKVKIVDSRSNIFETVNRIHVEGTTATVRSICDWSDFTDTLVKHKTEFLNLKRVIDNKLSTAEAEVIFSTLFNAISEIKTLKRMDVRNFPVSSIERMTVCAPQLEVFTTQSILSDSLNLGLFGAMTNLTELYLKGRQADLILDGQLSNLKSLKVLSLLKFGSFDNESLKAIGLLTNLEMLEIGSCAKIPVETATDAILNLRNLKRLRFEKGPESEELVIQIIESVSKLPQLEIFELVHFTLKPGFEQALAKCGNIRSLLLIPYYSMLTPEFPLTNLVAMVSIGRLATSLKHFVWGFNSEIFRNTSRDPNHTTMQNLPAESSNAESTGNKEEKENYEHQVPILTSAIDILKKGKNIEDAVPLLTNESPEIGTIPISEFQNLMCELLPSTKVQVVARRFRNMWDEKLP